MHTRAHSLVLRLLVVTLLVTAAVAAAPAHLGVRHRAAAAGAAALHFPSQHPFRVQTLQLKEADNDGNPTCYGRYCGLAEECADGERLDPATRLAPIDRLDAACFLHDLCYTCAKADAGSCCPDPSLAGVDQNFCDRIFLERLKNDELCSDEGGNDNLFDKAQCETVRAGAVSIFETRVAADEDTSGEPPITGSGLPSATSNPNATCDAFSCPYTVSGSCFQPCGDDGCSGRCGSDANGGSDGGDGGDSGSECPSDHFCHPYAHACFRQSDTGGDGGGGDGGDGDGLGDGVGGGAVSASRPSIFLAALAILAVFFALAS